MTKKRDDATNETGGFEKLIEEARRGSSGSWTLAESYLRYLRMRRDYEDRLKSTRGAAAPAQRYQANP